MDCSRHGAILHMEWDSGTGPTKEYGGELPAEPDRVLCQKERHGFTEGETLPWKNTHMGLPKENQAIQTPIQVQGLTGDPGELTQSWAWHQTAPPSLTAWGAGGIPLGFAVRGTY